MLTLWQIHEFSLRSILLPFLRDASTNDDRRMIDDKFRKLLFLSYLLVWQRAGKERRVLRISAIRGRLIEDCNPICKNGNKINDIRLWKYKKQSTDKNQWQMLQSSRTMGADVRL